MGILNTSTLLLSSYFIHEFRKIKVAKEYTETHESYRNMVIKQFEELLRKGNGLDFRYLMTLIKKAPVEHTAFPNDLFSDDAKFKINKLLYQYPKDKNELIEFTKFYFHPVLQERSSFPVYIFNEMTGDIELKETEPYYLEIVDSFTKIDLVNYFLKQTNHLDTKNDNETKRKGLFSEFTKLLDTFSLDEILYLIDATVMTQKEIDRPMPLFAHDILNHIELAENLLSTRKQTLEEGGDNHVTPRTDTYNI